MTRDKECSQIWILMAGKFIYILCFSIWIIFSFTDSFDKGRKMKNPRWLRLAGEVLSIFFTDACIFTYVSFLDCQEQANVSVKCGYILKEKSSISYTVMHLAYMFSLTAMTVEHTCGCNQKDRFCLFYYIQIHISQFYKFWIKIQGNHLTQLV